MVFSVFFISRFASGSYTYDAVSKQAVQPDTVFSRFSQLSPVPKTWSMLAAGKVAKSPGKIPASVRKNRWDAGASVPGQVDEGVDKFGAKAKGGGGDDHNFAVFLHPVPVEHLEHNAREVRVIDGTSTPRESVSFPVFRWCRGSSARI